VAAGRVVVSAPEPIHGLRAAAAKLEHVQGRGAIPAGRLTLQYEQRSLNDWFCRLSPAPPDPVPLHRRKHRGDSPARAADRRAAVQPVWLSVNVPADAPPGDYEGDLSIATKGARPVRVPVRLHVADWRLPAAREFAVTVGVYQSPTSLAMHYKVPVWSERHWELMDRSFELLGRLGCDLVNLLVVDRTTFGNEEGMIYWVKRADGSFEHDFRVLERYVALVKKHLGVPRFVTAHVWHAAGWASRKADQENTVTVVDAATGKRSHLQVPAFDSEQAKAFWKPLFAGLRRRLAAHGMEESLCVGIISDGHPPQEVCAMFNEILAPARWMRSSHPANWHEKPTRLRGGGTIVYNEGVYGVRPQPLEKVFPLTGLQTKPGLYIQRDNNGQPGALSVLSSRTMPEWGLYSLQRGFGRVGLDYWPGLIPRGNSGYVLFRRWLRSRAHPGGVNPPWLCYPGPDGPQTSVCLESMREGLQESEAVVQISRALEAHPDRLGPALAAACRRLLADRYAFVRRGPRYGWQKVYYHLNHYGWQALSRRTYALAGRLGRAPSGQ
jgi:hypothetical protein